MSSSEEEEGTQTPSDYDPEGEPDLSPQRPTVTTTRKRSESNTSRAKKSNPSRAKAGNSRTNVPASPTAGSSGAHAAAAAAAAQAQAQAFQQAGYMMPAMGPGGIPMMVPGQPGNERAHLYTLLRQLPIGPQGVGPGGLPFPFPMHPGLLAAAANISNDPIPSAHDAEAPPGESADSPSRMSNPGSPSKPRAEPGTIEWAQQRKDNHKEVERRRRGNINEGINELGRILPNNSGDKAKGAILQRAVAYLKQLKENEQKVMEKWTIEKLMLDREIAEWGLRYSECEARWKEEKARREDLEAEVAKLKRMLGDLEEDELEEDEELDERPVKRPRLV
ncbi:hypothetical protein M408DRAFT_332089 [Serendipita vermifera MAFF 305830]|uniref:BHLH domain-containing protein n=1 Tax=Serendipita vermifera MAFF 305830 TaxID=933852 RepID=A0A0C2WBS9_SERVB|nr:hypothetical protein M408DRAFT_332089 [Serendipita vermifera MAFF 305830]